MLTCPRILAALALAAALAAPAAAGAQQTPCAGCAVTRIESINQVQTHQIIVNGALQNQLSTQLQTQSGALANEALLRSLRASELNAASYADLQRLLIQEQILLLRLRQAQPAARPATPRKEPGHTVPN